MEILTAVLNGFLTIGLFALGIFVRELISKINSVVNKLNEISEKVAVLDEITATEKKEMNFDIHKLEARLDKITDKQSQLEQDLIKVQGNFANSIKQLEIIYEHKK